MTIRFNTWIKADSLEEAWEKLRVKLMEVRLGDRIREVFTATQLENGEQDKKNICEQISADTELEIVGLWDLIHGQKCMLEGYLKNLKLNNAQKQRVEGKIKAYDYVLNLMRVHGLDIVERAEGEKE